MADNFWGDGGVNRVDLIDSRVGDRTDLSVAEAFSIVQDAATADMRGQLVLPEMIALLDGTEAPDERIAQAFELLKTWVADGAHRRDQDKNWFYDAPSVPVNDQLWERLVHAVYDTDFGDPDGDGPVDSIYERLRPRKFDDRPSIVGSAFQFGWYSLVERDLRAVRTGDLSGLAAGARCGGGDLGNCRADLWSALEEAVSAAGPAWVPPHKFQKWTGFERIVFLPVIFNPNTMRWSNRSTFQQLVTFGQ